ncbi:centrosomal protein of 72 kDa isoform X1 [Anguilla anguilla]|uniref:centrosomal protein of 72 kDa isoform X1 n=2 Tax=Anguilla anguilla TaxID=7936 RepID=UPI0015B005B3|nr:centrosomal protein of 72 kDa isoform X1 [Anguilla anguilla]
MAAEHLLGTEQLTITEQWIREKVRLQHTCLVDVKSLSLPGSYEGKIRHLGNSLKNFVRLKVLDLSHNALFSVEGLLHLNMLEHLNLYYNKIASLREVLLLRKLKALKELDLRLNPVVKNCVDYRLHLVYTLANLRMLDDCPVRDGERKASLQQFSGQTVVECQQVACSVSDTANQRSSQPRMTSVNRLTWKPSVLDHSDDEILNMVAKSNWDLSKPPALTGSTNKQPESKLYPLQDNLEKGEYRSEGAPSPMQDMNKSILRHPENIRDKHQPQSSVQPPKGVALNKGNGSVRVSEGLRVTFVDAKKIRPRPGSEIERLGRFPARGNFTPNPGGPRSPPAPHGSTLTSHPPSPGTTARSIQDALPLPSSTRLSPHSPLTERAVPLTENSSKKELMRKPPSNDQNSGPRESYRRPLELLLGLVDRHWDGKRSLQHNHKFLSQAIEILSTMKQDDSNGEVEANSQRVNKELMKSERNRLQKEHRAEIERLSEQLKNAHCSIEDLDQQLRCALEENVSLQKQLIRVEQRLLASGRNGTQDPELTGRQAAAEELKGEVEQMQEEVEQLRARVKQAEKVQGLADMLQESHRSLVSTNERLLAELEECRARHRVEVEENQARHKAEVEKLHFSFSELSRTLSLMSDINKTRPEDS